MLAACKAAHEGATRIYEVHCSKRVGGWQVIMYDEPTAGLDPVASTVVEDLIRSLHRSVTPLPTLSRT